MRPCPAFLLLAACAGSPTQDPAPPAADTAQDTGDGVLRAPLSFPIPLLDPERFSMTVGVDHDPVVQDAGIDQLFCADYLGRAFPHCYDEHDGSDFILQGGFNSMDEGSTPILAAAPGLVVYAEDGNSDHCHGDLGSGSNTCDGYDMVANAVILEHEGGWRTLYWHMMKGSVAVALGDEVQTGDQLGIVGSSGNSYTPHLHFELQDADEVVIDPFAGPESQPETWWCDQGDGDELPGGCD